MTSLGSQFYFPPSRLKFIATVQSQIESGRVVAVEGETGCGKTVILEELLTSVFPNANKCYVTAGRQINDIQLRSRIIEQLFGNVLFDPEKPLISSFLEFNQNTELLIVIDNTHYLSGQIIGELLQLYSELNSAGIVIGVVLSFDKSISTTLLNVNSSILSVNTVPLLSFEESYQLLKHYVEELPASNNSKVKRWIENAKGIPIQLLAYDQENDLVVSPYSSINIKLWGTVVVTFSVLLALVIHAYNLGYFESEPESVDSKADALVKPWNQPARLGREEPAPYPVTSAASNTKPEIVAVETASPEDILASILTTDSEEKGAPPVNERTSDEAETQPEQTLETPETSENVVVEVLPQPEVVSDVSEQSSERNTENEITGPGNDQISGNQTNSIYKIDNSVFFSLPSDQFVLQLTAVSSEATLRQYLQSANLDLEKVRVYRIARNGKDWIVVTYGLYTSITEARADAVDVDAKAWAKSVAVIQQQITSYQRSAVN